MWKSVLERLTAPIGGKEKAPDVPLTETYLDQMGAITDAFVLPGLRREESIAMLAAPLIDVRMFAPPTGSQNAKGPAKSEESYRDVSGARSIWDFLKATSLSQVRAFGVIGLPGSGRTTLLMHLCHALAHRRHGRFEVKSQLPVLISLREQHPALLTDPSPGLDDFLKAYLHSRLPKFSPPDTWYAEQLRQGSWLILLDGLDEVDETPKRHALARWLNRQIEAFPGARFVYTIRPQAQQDTRIDHMCTLEALPLKGEASRRFFEGWFLGYNSANRKGGTIGEDGNPHQVAAKQAQGVFASMRSHASLIGLTTTPQLASALARLSLQKGGLPPRKANLLEAVCTILAETSATPVAQGAQPALSGTQRIGVLRALADHLSRAHGRDMSLEDVKKIGGAVLPSGSAMDTFLVEARKGAGPLQEREIGHFRFAHTLIQESLLSQRLREKPPSGRRLEQMVQDSYWHESLALLAAQSDPTPIVQAALTLGTISALTLATECLEVASPDKPVDPKVREAANLVLVKPLGSDDMKARRLATEVRLQRRVKSLCRMDDQREIDLDYISTAEYQLFLDEMRERGHYYQPDHWPSMRYAKGAQDTPVSGIRPEDARDFCVWLNARLGVARYRLPRPEEARAFPARSDALSCWCRDGDMYTLVGLERNAEQTIQQKLRDLSLISIPLTLPLERGLNRNVDIIFNKAVLQALDLRPDAIVEQNLMKAMDHVREILMVRAMDLGTVISPDLDLARVLGRASKFSDLSASVERFDVRTARTLIDEIIGDYDEFSPEGRFATLMGAILEASECESVQGVQQGQRKYFSLCAQWAYEMIGQDESAGPQRRGRQQMVAEFHGWLQIMLARAEGKLMTWEGIRLVRDQTLLPGAEQMLDLPAWAYNA